jgi:hypothetical protein
MIKPNTKVKQRVLPLHIIKVLQPAVQGSPGCLWQSSCPTQEELGK